MKEAKGHPKFVFIAMASLILIGVLGSYSSQKRQNAKLEIVSKGFRLVTGKIVKTSHSGKGVRRAEIEYSYNGNLETIVSRYLIPCRNQKFHSLSGLINSKVPVAISTIHYNVAVELISESDFKRVGAEYEEVTIAKYSCLSKAVNFSW